MQENINLLKRLPLNTDEEVEIINFRDNFSDTQPRPSTHFFELFSTQQQ